MNKKTLQKLAAKMDRIPDEREMKKLEKVLEVEAENGFITVEDGHEFIRNLRKEARRQEAAKSAEELETQAKEICNVPMSDNSVEEAALADSFEIIEED